MKLLAISSSPRKSGNSETLLQYCASTFDCNSENVDFVRLADLQVSPCLGCEKCNQSGECVLKDDFAALFDKMISCDILLWATPIYFMSVTAQAKIIIDRTQCAWVRRTILNKPFSDRGEQGKRRAAVLAVAAQRNKKGFGAVELMMNYCLPNLGLDYSDNLFVVGVDAKGAINDCDEAKKRSQALGQLLAEGKRYKKDERSTIFVDCS